MFAEDPLFWKAIGNTVYMVLGIPLGMALSLGIALLLNLEIRGVAVWRTFFYLPIHRAGGGVEHSLDLDPRSERRPGEQHPARLRHARTELVAE